MQESILIKGEKYVQKIDLSLNPFTFSTFGMYSLHTSLFIMMVNHSRTQLVHSLVRLRSLRFYVIVHCSKCVYRSFTVFHSVYKAKPFNRKIKRNVFDFGYIQTIELCMSICHFICWNLIQLRCTDWLMSLFCYLFISITRQKAAVLDQLRLVFWLVCIEFSVMY